MAEALWRRGGGQSASRRLELRIADVKADAVKAWCGGATSVGVPHKLEEQMELVISSARSKRLDAFATALRTAAQTEKPTVPQLADQRFEGKTFHGLATTFEQTHLNSARTYCRTIQRRLKGALRGQTSVSAVATQTETETQRKLFWH